MNSPKEEAESLALDDSPGEPRILRPIPDFSSTITMAQIAKAAGVSQGAISSLLNDRDYGIRVSEKTRERVFKVCREMGYLPNDLRAVVRMYPELGEYCLLLSRDLGNAAEEPGMARLSSAAVAAVPNNTRALNLARYDPDVDYSTKPEALPQPVRVGVASKFLGFGEPNPSLISIITKRGLPFVQLGTAYNAPGVVNFVPDYASASMLALDYLAKLGHRRIAIVSGPFGTGDTAVLEYNRGVRQAFESLKIPMEMQHIVYGELNFAAGVAAADTLLERSPRPTAIYCFSDAVAAGAIARMLSRGIKVPEEISVIGCGGDPVGLLTLPALTTINLPMEELARRGVDEIEQLTRADGVAGARTVSLPVRLIERGSCQPPRAD